MILEFEPRIWHLPRKWWISWDLWHFPKHFYSDSPRVCTTHEQLDHQTESPRHPPPKVECGSVMQWENWIGWNWLVLRQVGKVFDKKLWCDGISQVKPNIKTSKTCKTIYEISVDTRHFNCFRIPSAAWSLETTGTCHAACNAVNSRMSWLISILSRSIFPIYIYTYMYTCFYHHFN